MGSIKGLIRQIKRNPQDVRFADIQKVCQYYFGEPRLTSGHYIYKTPWKGDPRINIQNDKGKAKGYQVKQVLKAIERMGVEHGTDK